MSPTFWAVLSQAGAPGAAGAAGATGPQGPAGAVGVTYRGAWVASTAYHANDVVGFNGATYLAAYNFSWVGAGCLSFAVGGAGAEWKYWCDGTVGCRGDG